jgi:hypothetical protein
MSGTIKEIPLDNTEIIEIVHDIPEIVPDSPDIVANSPPILGDISQFIDPPYVAPVKPKAQPKGRPPGAPNKGPSKPRAKVKAQIQEAPVERSYEPSSPKRVIRVAEPSPNEVASAMLLLLQEQSNSAQSRKQRLYSSWFP